MIVVTKEARPSERKTAWNEQSIAHAGGFQLCHQLTGPFLHSRYSVANSYVYTLAANGMNESETQKAPLPRL